MKRIFRRLTALVFICLLLAGCVSCAAAETSDGPLTVTFLDVGKGDCILLQKDGKSILIDAGYEETSSDVLSALRKAGAEKLDVFIVTHYDKDHVGGAAAIANALSVEQLYLPGYEGEGEYYTALLDAIEAKSIPAVEVTEDVRFTLADVSITIYASEIDYTPASGKKEGNDNDVSLIVTALWGEDSYLFAGDIEEEGVESYLAADLGTFDVVKLPHHGRKESNTDEFIESVQPKLAIITDSEDETADKKVLKALTAAEATVYCTSEFGTVVLTSTGVGEYAVQTQKG